ncbi:MAG: hypothetical protein IJ710_05915 [Prevotella sp.]|nr:hypothetical protein [Prevotella sp.]
MKRRFLIFVAILAVQQGMAGKHKVVVRRPDSNPPINTEIKVEASWAENNKTIYVIPGKQVGQIDVSIRDIMGRTVFTEQVAVSQTDETAIDLPDTSGSLLLEVTDDQNTVNVEQMD